MMSREDRDIANATGLSPAEAEKLRIEANKRFDRMPVYEMPVSGADLANESSPRTYRERFMHEDYDHVYAPRVRRIGDDWLP